MKEQVLKAMREAGKPVSAGDVTKALNADRKEADKGNLLHETDWPDRVVTCAELEDVGING